MDQLIIDVEFSILADNALDLIELIRNSGNDDLLPYADEIEQCINSEI